MKKTLLIFCLVLSNEGFSLGPRPDGPVTEDVPMVSGYSHYKVGETFYGDTIWDKFDYARYITYYNIQQEEEPSREFPEIYEECADYWRLATFEKSFTVETSLEASVGLEKLGFKSSLSLSTTIKVSRNLSGKRGEEAIHVPVLMSQSWVGETYIQKFYEDRTFSELSRLKEPTFRLDYVKPIFRVRRTEVKPCD